ncbi:MAG: DUF3298 domain-containing protein [Patescibacteria group bacterium]
MKKIILLVGIIIIVASIVFAYKNRQEKMTPVETGDQSVPISIEVKEIKEKNYSGSYPVVTGTGALADTARKYITDTISEFADTANEDVPLMREQFGPDSPPSHYTIDMNATYRESTTTESLVIDEYAYTGGANGNSIYKVFTSSRKSGKIISLTDILIDGKESSFVSFVKGKLLAWRPEGMEEQPVFPEDVNAITLDLLDNWSLDGESLTIYFSKYAIGPGALGAVDFPISRAELAPYVKSAYLK